MKRARSLTVLGVLVTLAACSCFGNFSTSAGATPGPVAAPFVVKLIGFNDFHGNLESKDVVAVRLRQSGLASPSKLSAMHIAGRSGKLNRHLILNQN